MTTGTSIAQAFPDSASSVAISPHKLKTLQDLLSALKGTDGSHLTQMLQTTAVHITNCLERPPDQIRIEELSRIRLRLKAFLQERKYKRNTVRTYLNNLRIMTDRAGRLGWVKDKSVVELAWRKSFYPLFENETLPGAIDYAIDRKIMPGEFTEAHLERWAESLRAAGRSISHVDRVKRAFRDLVYQRGPSKDTPEPRANDDAPDQRAREDAPKVRLRISRPDYGVPLAEFPQGLREEIDELIEWKTKPFILGRPAKARIREVSASSLKEIFCLLYGFATRVRKMEIKTIHNLFCRELIEHWVVWCLNERSLKTKSLVKPLSMIRTIVATHKDFNASDYEWIRDLIGQLPKDSDTDLEEMKDRKWVDYDELALLPDKIRRNAELRYRSNARKTASAARDQLIIALLTTLPWRRRNLAECRIGESKNRANIFKEEVPQSVTMAKPQWVEDALKADPHAKIWRFRFHSDETKSGHAVEGVLPRRLIPLLEEYLEKYRPILVTGNDPNTLFVNNAGGRFSNGAFGLLVRNITSRYTGKPANPHLFRDIFAVKWLRENRRDYLALSKILWHRDISVTLKIYARNFDESDGACAVEEWLEERKSNVGCA